MSRGALRPAMALVSEKLRPMAVAAASVWSKMRARGNFMVGKMMFIIRMKCKYFLKSHWMMAGGGRKKQSALERGNGVC